MTIEMSESEYFELLEESTGVCLGCGEHHGCCEPDAREYKCDACGEHKVYGVEELVLMGELEIS